MALCVQAAEFSTLFDTGIPGTEPLDSAQKDYLFPVTMNVRVAKRNGVHLLHDTPLVHPCLSLHIRSIIVCLHVLSHCT